MISNILGNVRISSKKFKLINRDIQSISEGTNADVLMDCNIDKMDCEEVLKRIKEFALLDNAGVDLFTKYENKKTRSIVVKAFNINPNVNGYGIIAREKTEELELGIKVFKKIFKEVNVKFAVDGSDKECEKILSNLGQVVKVNKTLDLYNEKLVNKVFGKEINASETLIEDLLTLIYLGKSFKDGILSNEIYLTVYGGAIEGNKVVSAKPGISFNDIFNYLNGNIEVLKKVIVNGSINGDSKYNMDGQVDHSIKSILFLTEKDSQTQESCSCIRCSRCLRACPEGLNPIKLKELWNRKEKEEFLKFGGEKCIECGLCSYVCPSNIEIAQDIKTGKAFNK